MTVSYDVCYLSYNLTSSTSIILCSMMAGNGLEMIPMKVMNE
jgi:hypothetical protein